MDPCLRIVLLVKEAPSCLHEFSLDLEVDFLLLQDDHVVCLLGGLCPAKDRVRGQPLVVLLPRVDD